jgi:cytochrome b subunit of formate dehydrogenase
VARYSDRRYNVIATKWWMLGILLVVALFLAGVLIWNFYVNAIAR